MNKITEEYLENFKLYLDVEKNFSQHTIRAYSSDILSFLIWLGETDISEVDYVKLKDYLVFMQKFQYSKTTTARKIAGLRTFFKYLHREGVVGTNPAKGIHSPKKNKNLPKFLTEEETEEEVTPSKYSRGDRIRAAMMAEGMEFTNVRRQLNEQNK